MKERRSVTQEIAGRYQRASKKQNGLILNEFDRETEEKLLRISASTIDRLLREEKKKYTLTRSRKYRKNDNIEFISNLN